MEIVSLDPQRAERFDGDLLADRAPTTIDARADDETTAVGRVADRRCWCDVKNGGSSAYPAEAHGCARAMDRTQPRRGCARGRYPRLESPELVGGVHARI